MKIERVDDKTVKCYLSNEELEEFEIDYKDFVMRSEKAKEVVQEIIELAQEEVGYKPPKFAFDLQIMMVPDQGLVLTFSERDPLDFKEGEQILECLKDMKKALQKNKEELNNAREQITKKIAGEQAAEKEAAEKESELSKKMPVDHSVFVFRNVSRMMEYASILPGNLRVKSVLYLLDGVYYLYISKGAASYERYTKACIQALEFGTWYPADQRRIEYLKEHGECLIEEYALKKLRLN